MEIYLDNSATTRVSPPVAEHMLHMMTEQFGNPSSLHRKGFLAEQALTGAREKIAAVLGARREEIIFTPGGSAANNLAILGTAAAYRRKGNKIVATAVEHESVLAPVRHLGQNGYTVVFVPPRADGSVDPQEIARAVDESTILVSAMYVNSETGSINDIREISRLIKRKNPSVLLHSDCVQGFGKLPITPEKWGVDLVSISAHKIHGPKGVGALYAAKGVRLQPLYYGSGQEKGLIPGTENLPGCCGFALAAQLIWEKRQQNEAHFRDLRCHLLEKASQIDGVCINSPENGAPYIVNLSIPSVRSEVMIHHLEQSGIFVSSGSACARGKRSHVLTAMGLPEKQIDGALRISFCTENTFEDIDALIECLTDGLSTLAGRR